MTKFISIHAISTETYLVNVLNITFIYKPVGKDLHTVVQLSCGKRIETHYSVEKILILINE